MQGLRLSVNGIDKLIGNLNGIVVQIVSVEQKFQNNQCYYSCEFNDGYCKIKGCVIDSMEKVEKHKLRNYMVIKVNKAGVQKNKKQKYIVIVQNYELIADKVKGLVGNPILYEDYIKNDKNNPEGDNLVPLEKGAQNNPKKESKVVQKKVQVEPQQESKTSNDQNSKANKIPQKNPPKVNNQTAKPQIQNNTKESVSRDKPVQQKSKPGPIEKLQKKQESRTQSFTAGKQKKPNNEYTQIRSLYVGMQNWTILARIIAINPLKAFVNKKGIQSYILNFEMGDKSGCIECTIFGQSAQRFEGILKQDQIYQISNGIINQNSYLGSHKLKVTITQTSKVNIKEDDPNVPYMEDFYISVKKLTELPLGEEARVICLIKDDRQIQNFISKEGKSLRKKIIVLCDPIQKVEVDITVWSDACQFKYQKYPYMIKGVMVKQYQGNRQYSLKGNHKATILKQHSLRKYIKDIDNISFSNPDSNNKPKRANISNFKDLNNALDDGSNNNGTWSEVVCFVTAIRNSSKNYYISCPKCKKKVVEQENASCISCDHFYDHAQYRYVLSLNVADFSDSVWINAYDEAGEILMGISAQQFASMKEQQVQEHMKKVKYRYRKLKLITKNEEYNSNIRKKTNIIKVLDLNYAEQTKLLLEKIKNLIAK